MDTTEPTTKFGSYHIPDDLILKILENLPAKSLLRFRSVCKHWRSLIAHPGFVDNHRLRSYNRPGGIKILMEREGEGEGEGEELMLVDLEGNMSRVPPPPGLPFVPGAGYPVVGVEGLICFGDKVWNPTTRKTVHLPPHPQRMNEFCLGFDAVAKQNKVLSICQTSVVTKSIDHFNYTIDNEVVGEGRFQIQVLTLGTNSWRNITHRLPVEESRYMDMVHMSRDMDMDMALMGANTLRLSLYLKNELYFLIRYPHHLGLMAFSVTDETFKFQHLPDCIDVRLPWAMMEVHECVALLGLDGIRSELWVLNDFDTAKWGKIAAPSWLRSHHSPALYGRENTVICAINPTEALVESKYWNKRKRVYCLIGDVKNKRLRSGPNLKGMQALEIYSKHVETLFDPTAMHHK